MRTLLQRESQAVTNAYGCTEAEQGIWRVFAEDSLAGMAIFEQLEDGFRLRWANNSFRNLLGLSCEAVLLHWELHRLLPSAGDDLAEIFCRVATAGEPYEEADYHVRVLPNGSPHWWFSVKRVHDPGSPCVLLFQAIDLPHDDRFRVVADYTYDWEYWIGPNRDSALRLTLMLTDHRLFGRGVPG